MYMDKLTDFIPQFRIDQETKKTIIEMAYKRKRKPTEFIRMCLEHIAQDYKNGGHEKYNY